MKIRVTGETARYGREPDPSNPERIHELCKTGSEGGAADSVEEHAIGGVVEETARVNEVALDRGGGVHVACNGLKKSSTYVASTKL